MGNRNQDEVRYDGRTFEHVFDDVAALGDEQEKVLPADMRDAVGSATMAPCFSYRPSRRACCAPPWRHPWN